MLRVLTYHRVADAAGAPHLDPRLISASPAVFERQVRHLARNYRVVAAGHVLDSLQRGTPLPQRAVLITFDDAYADFASVAWPILRRHGLSATLFVATAYPDRPDRGYWWDRLYQAVRSARVDRLEASFTGTLSLRTAIDRRESLRRLHRWVKKVPHEEAMAGVDEVCSALDRPIPRDNGVLGWEQLRRLADEGVTLGAHTRTHPLLDRLAPRAALEEIAGSREDLRREIGSTPPILSYPDGAHDETVMRLAREAGFVLGFTTLDGLNDLSAGSRMRLRRTNVTSRTNAFAFRIRMLPPFARVDAWRHRSVGARS